MEEEEDCPLSVFSLLKIGSYQLIAVALLLQSSFLSFECCYFAEPATLMACKDLIVFSNFMS